MQKRCIFRRTFAGTPCHVQPAPIAATLPTIFRIPSVIAVPTPAVQIGLPTRCSSCTSRRVPHPHSRWAQQNCVDLPEKGSAQRNTQRHGLTDRLLTAVDVEFLVDIGCVTLNGPVRDKQALSDFFGAETLGQQFQHFQLTVG